MSKKMATQLSILERWPKRRSIKDHKKFCKVLDVQSDFFLDDFKYNPVGKGTERLPYYDMFPVVLVINVYDKYFQGINFHYLPPIYRAELMDQLYRFVIAPDVQSKDIGSSIRARLNTNRVDYGFMSKRFNLRSFKPMFKRYRRSNVVGPYLYVPPIGWDAVMMMPLQRFRGAGINRVYKDSLEKRRRRG